MSRIPMAGAAPAPGYRASMLRTRALPAATAPRPKVHRARAAHAVRKAPIARKVPIARKAVHRSARKPIRRQAAAPAVVVLRQPTPMPVAARELATPLSYALIRATICETGPGVGPIPIPAVTGPQVEDVAPRPETGLEFPPLGPPDVGPTGPLPGTPPTQPPTFEPRVDNPPVPDSPPTEPPAIQRPLTKPPTEPPLVAPPGVVSPFVTPTFQPPVVLPLTTPIPEPGAWMLMILGFGFVGAMVRRRRALDGRA